MTPEDDEDAWDDYESGPYCVHWDDPSDCEEKCAICGGECRFHRGRDHEFAGEVTQ